MLYVEIQNLILLRFSSYCQNYPFDLHNMLAISTLDDKVTFYTFSVRDLVIRQVVVLV